MPGVEVALSCALPTWRATTLAPFQLARKASSGRISRGMEFHRWERSCTSET